MLVTYVVNDLPLQPFSPTCISNYFSYEAYNLSLLCEYHCYHLFENLHNILLHASKMFGSSSPCNYNSIDSIHAIPSWISLVERLHIMPLLIVGGLHAKDMSLWIRQALVESVGAWIQPLFDHLLSTMLQITLSLFRTT